jgi:hypothetical protein
VTDGIRFKLSRKKNTADDNFLAENGKHIQCFCVSRLLKRFGAYFPSNV